MLPFLVNEEPKAVESSSVEEFVKSIKAFELNDIGQVIESSQRICSLAWHSNSSKPILAVGGSKGTICILIKQVCHSLVILLQIVFYL